MKAFISFSGMAIALLSLSTVVHADETSGKLPADGNYQIACHEISPADGGSFESDGIVQVKSGAVSGIIALKLVMNADQIPQAAHYTVLFTILPISGTASMNSSPFSSDRLEMHLTTPLDTEKKAFQKITLADNRAGANQDQESSYITYHEDNFSEICTLRLAK